MALSTKSLTDLFSNLKSAQDVTDVFAKPEALAWLKKPLSPDTPENALTYMMDGYFSDSWHKNYKEFTAASLDALEKAVPDADARVAVLTSVNSHGQSPLLLSLKFGGARGAFDPMLDALYKWAGEDKANAIMKDLLSQPLGKFDSDISYMLQDVRNMRTPGTPEYEKIDSLTTDFYPPMPAEGLRSTIRDIRPAIADWLAKESPDSDYGRERKAKMQAFYDSADPVTENGTVMTASFPGKAFFRLLDIYLKSDTQPAEKQADRIFALLSARNAEGNTPMHIKWTVSDLLGTPKSAGSFTDRLSPLLATFDRMLGTEKAVALSVKLLLQENAKGQLPLDILQYPKQPVRDFAFDKMLQTLRKEMGSKEKFATYVKEVIAPVLPTDYKISLASFEPEDAKADGSKPQRGAKLEL